MKKILFNIILCFVSTNIYSKLTLTKIEQENFNQNTYIVRETYSYNKTWPSITIIAEVASTPLEAISIFSAFELQKKYVPNLIQSKPIQKKINQIDVSYILDLPWPIPNAHYTNRHRFFHINNEYTIKWNQLKSTSSDECVGEAKFIRKNNKTIMIYQNYLKPSSAIAFLFKGKMKSDTIKNIQIIIKIINLWTHEKSVNYHESLKKSKLILSNRIAY